MNSRCCICALVLFHYFFSNFMDFDHEVLYLFLFQRVNQENRMSILENSVGEGNSFFEWIGEGNSMIHKDNSSDYNNSKDGTPRI